LEIQKLDNREDNESEQFILFINEEIVSKSPQIQIQFENKESAIALLDSGSEVNLISQNKFNQLESSGIALLTLPVQGINLITAFGKKSKCVKLQLLTEFSIDEEKFEAVFLVAPQLNCDVILGCQFLKEHRIQLCFDTGTIEYSRQGLLKSFKFKLGTEDKNENVQAEEVIASSYVATKGNYASDENQTGRRGETYAGVTAVTHASFKPLDDVNSSHSPRHHVARADVRDLQTGELFHIIDRSSEIDSEQKLQLFQMLHKYLLSFTMRPGKCRLLEYKFQVNADQPLRSFSRPVPFAMRHAVKAQIQEMIRDDILELSQSDILNPLTVVPREGKKLRICVDARKVNQFTVPDYERTPPLQELLQRFEGAKFITSLDLNSAFLQIPLHKDSRKYTAFLYDSVVYQYKRVPYGFKNSLPAFMRALRLALGEGNETFVLAYVDDILVYSKTFTEHVRHLDIVVKKLTQAGFTLNADKCKFCIKEIKFLGHVISQAGVAADPTRINAILNYPRPRNQKQLRQFLGTCNFHNRFILKYSEYVAPLLSLLKKGTKWTWTPEKEQAFRVLRNQFANSIQLAHPREDLPFEIYTDASKVGISAILSQKNETEEIAIISTASRVLTEVERRYSVCEQELLAVVYAIKKFRIYIACHPVTIYSDNKALSFLRKCNLTSDRVTRWIMFLQGYNLQIKHISGTKNCFADILSRNPADMTLEQQRSLNYKQEVLVAKIDLGTNKEILKQLKELPRLQQEDPCLQKIRDEIQTNPTQEKYSVQQGMLCLKDLNKYPYWRIMLPKRLEIPVFKYIHYSLGHLGTDKCLNQIAAMFYIKNLGRKLRKFIASCDICQKVKHPNRSVKVTPLSHVPKNPGELVAVDLYGPLPTGRGGVKHLFVCLEVFSKHVALYPLKAATTRGCLRKITDHYIERVIKPKIILSDHGSQFTSTMWKETLENLGIEVRYSPIRHPESNPAERVMKELGKFFRIYCNETHKQWPELVGNIQDWLNQTVCQTTGYKPIELLEVGSNRRIFAELIRKLPDQPRKEELPIKILKAYNKIKEKAEKRKNQRKKGRFEWTPQVGDLVLVRGQPTSDAVRGIIGKFQRAYEGPFIVGERINSGLYKLKTELGENKGLFHISHLKPYITPEKD
jgi:hypothetical protein